MKETALYYFQHKMCDIMFFHNLCFFIMTIYQIPHLMSAFWQFLPPKKLAQNLHIIKIKNDV